MAEKIYIISNGNQAPYRIGEIIDIIPKAHFRKIYEKMSSFRKPPIMRRGTRDGMPVFFDFEIDNRKTKLIGIKEVVNHGTIHCGGY